MRPLQMEKLLSARARPWRLAEQLGLDESLKQRGAHDASRVTRYNIARFRLLDVPNPAPTSGLQLLGSIVWIANNLAYWGIVLVHLMARLRIQKTSGPPKSDNLRTSSSNSEIRYGFSIGKSTAG